LHSSKVGPNKCIPIQNTLFVITSAERKNGNKIHSGTVYVNIVGANYK